MAIRQMLLQLHDRGFDIEILGMTVFDAPAGAQQIQKHIEQAGEKNASLVKIVDGPLVHELIRTGSTERDRCTNKELESLFASFQQKIGDNNKPDLIFYYGGRILNMLIASEAKANGIPTVAYLANGNYSGKRWCRDVDLIITDSKATAQMYKEKDGIDVVPVGAFIDPRQVIARKRDPKNLLFINPSLAKGVGIVIQIALLLEKIRPDITIEVVESRGNWPATLRTVTKHLGAERESLPNVIVIPNSTDMRPIYARAKLLLAPSLCWESAGRVVAEALMNGIPTIVTNRGGLPEMLGNAGVKIDFSPKCYEKPYTHLPKTELLQPVVEWIIQMYEDDAKYQEYSQRSKAVAAQRHNIAVNTGRLVKALDPILTRIA